MCRYMEGRSLIRQRPEASLVLALPAAEVGSGELMAVPHADLGHTGCITSALLNLATDVVVAVGPGHKRLQLFHGHGEPPEGFLTANQTWGEHPNPSVFLPQCRRGQRSTPGRERPCCAGAGR